MTNQSHIDDMIDNLRRAVIVALLQRDLLENNVTIKVPEEEMMWRANEIFNLNCCTRMLPSLFHDVRVMREEKGQFPSPVSVGELKWCLENRIIGYQCNQRVPYGWLPYKSDRDLRALPEFKAINNEYRLMISQGKPILPPSKKEKVTNLNRIEMELDISKHNKREVKQ